MPCHRLPHQAAGRLEREADGVGVHDGGGEERPHAQGQERQDLESTVNKNYCPTKPNW